MVDSFSFAIYSNIRSTQMATSVCTVEQQWRKIALQLQHLSILDGFADFYTLYPQAWTAHARLYSMKQGMHRKQLGHPPSGNSDGTHYWIPELDHGKSAECSKLQAIDLDIPRTKASFLKKMKQGLGLIDVNGCQCQSPCNQCDSRLNPARKHTPGRSAQREGHNNKIAWQMYHHWP